MNIAILGWARLTEGAKSGGGYNLIAQQHAKSLANQEDQVFYLGSGLDFTLFGSLINKTKQKILFEEKWQGIFIYSLVNSHNWAPAYLNGAHIDTQNNDTDQDNLIISWLKKNQIEQVFIHSLEGQSFSLLSRIKAEGLSLSLFCHDYYFLCPRVTYMYKGLQPCLYNEGGKRCISCFFIDKYYQFKRIIKKRFPFLKKQKDISENLFESMEIKDIIRNDVLLESLEQKNDPNGWGKRNNNAITALNLVDNVISPSLFLGKALQIGGLIKKKLKVVKIGLKHLDILKEQTVSGGPYDGRLHFGFHGGKAVHKGAFILIQAIELLSKEIRQQSVFHLWGLELPEPMEGVFTYPSYQIDELLNHGSMYHVGILSHIWFENSPVALLEHIAMGKPVITPRLGGVEDYIEEGKNGWFFEAGNPNSLALLLEEIIKTRKIPKPDRSIINSQQEFFQSLD